LLKRGDVVECVDNLSTGSAKQIEKMRNHPRFTFIQADVVDPELVSDLADRRYADIYDLACPTGVPNISSLGEEMLLVSSAGTRNLIKLSERTKARFLFASTAEAYGDPEIVPQSETYFGNVDPVGARSPYEEGKRFGEAMTAYYARERGLNARIVRIFNCYGPNMSERDQRVVPRMLKFMARSEPVVIYGNGEQTRSFCHVDDLLDGIELVMERGTPGGVYNIGSERELTVLELFNLAAKKVGIEARAVFEEHFIADHWRRCPDVSKVKALGWEERIPIEDGLEQCYLGMLAKTKYARADAGRKRRLAEHPAGVALSA
jgi:nucleoside-diphosphate-sugar epimerase